MILFSGWGLLVIALGGIAVALGSVASEHFHLSVTMNSLFLCTVWGLLCLWIGDALRGSLFFIKTQYWSLIAVVLGGYIFVNDTNAGKTNFEKLQSELSAVFNKVKADLAGTAEKKGGKTYAEAVGSPAIKGDRTAAIAGVGRSTGGQVQPPAPVPGDVAATPPSAVGKKPDHPVLTWESRQTKDKMTDVVTTDVTSDLILPDGTNIEVFAVCKTEALAFSFRTFQGSEAKPLAWNDKKLALRVRIDGGDVRIATALEEYTNGGYFWFYDRGTVERLTMRDAPEPENGEKGSFVGALLRFGTGFGALELKAMAGGTIDELLRAINVLVEIALPDGSADVIDLNPQDPALKAFVQQCASSLASGESSGSANDDNDKSGKVLAERGKPYIGTSTVDREQVNVRSTPNARDGTNVVAKIVRGTKVNIIGHVDGVWDEVEFRCDRGERCHGFINTHLLLPN